MSESRPGGVNGLHRNGRIPCLQRLEEVGTVEFLIDP